MTQADGNSLATARASASKKRKRSKELRSGKKSLKTSPSAKSRDSVPHEEKRTRDVEAVDDFSNSSLEELETLIQRDGIRAANALLPLVKRVVAGEPDCIRAMHITRRALASLTPAAKADDTLKDWIATRRHAFNDALVDIIGSTNASDEQVDNALAVAALGDEQVWRMAVDATLHAPSERAVQTAADCFVSRFADLRLFTLRALKVAPEPLDASRALILLEACGAPPECTSVRDASAVPKESISLRIAYGEAWLRILGLNMTSEQHSRAMSRLSTEVLPRVKQPLAFADILTRLYNKPETAVSALDGLYYLIESHKLDYPLFYLKLYALLTPDALWGADRDERFLDLASKFLRFGQYLSGGLVAAFIKRLARRALRAPPAAALWCLRLALDLLYKHPNISYLVHRSVSLFDASASTPAPSSLIKSDPFDDEAIDPQASGADASSLWELESLRTHISPAVSRLVAAFDRDVRKRPLPPPGSVEDYAGLSFADVFEAEFKRKAKSTPVAYDAPGCAPGVREVQEDLGGVLEWR